MPRLSSVFLLVTVELPSAVALDEADAFDTTFSAPSAATSPVVSIYECVLLTSTPTPTAPAHSRSPSLVAALSSVLPSAFGSARRLRSGLLLDAVLVADSGRQQIRPPFVFPFGQGLRLRVEQLHLIGAFADPDEIRLAARQSGDRLGFVPGVFVTGAIRDPITILKAVAGS